MTAIPGNPKIYHITHLGNLPQIVSDGCLWSDLRRIETGLDCEIVGMSRIKERRLKELPVPCHAGTMVGEYVPFYFCPRSIMLYILHRGNHPDITYREGQAPIVHLQADLRLVAQWADENGRGWAFSKSNAGARYTPFFNSLDKLNEVNWSAVRANDFRDPAIKEGKQAEFLMHESFPWNMVEKIGVINRTIQQQVVAAIAGAAHRPTVRIETGWYY